MRNEHATLNGCLTSRMFLRSYNRINTALWRLCSSSKAVTPLEPRIQQRIRQTGGLHVGMVVATVRLWIKSSQPFTSLFGEKMIKPKQMLTAVLTGVFALIPAMTAVGANRVDHQTTQTTINRYAHASKRHHHHHHHHRKHGRRVPNARSLNKTSW